MGTLATALGSVYARGSGGFLAFSRMLTNSLSVGRGAPAYEFNRASIATVEDHEGIIRQCKVNEARFTGARRVENECAHSENLLGDGWTNQSGGTRQKNVISGVAAGDGAKYLFTANSDQYTVSLDVSTIQAHVGKNTQLLIYDQTAGASRGSSSITALTDSNQRISHTWTNLIKGNTHNLYIYAGRVGDAYPVEMNVDRVQIENIAGQANQDPSEYVSVGVGTGSEIVPSVGFDNWADPTVPDGWNKLGTHNVSNYVEESVSGGLRLISDGTYVAAALQTTLVVGKTYAFEYELSDKTASTLNLKSGSQYGLVAGVGVRSTIVFVAGSVEVSIQRNSIACDVTLSYCSIKEIDHGANVDGVECFTTENGNSVDVNGIVTEANGAAISSDVLLGYLNEPQRTNLISDSEDLTAGTWGHSGFDILTPSVVKGINSHRIESVTATAGFKRTTMNITGLLGSTAYALRARFIAGEVTDVGLGIYDGTFVARTMFDLSTGAVSLSPDGTATIELIDAALGLYECTVYGTTQLTPTAGAIYIYANGLYSAEVVPIGDGFEVSGIQLEQGEFSTSYIPSSGGATTRQTDSLSYNGVNADALQGSFYMESTAQADSAQITNGYVLSFGVDGRLAYYHSTGEALTIYAGAGSATNIHPSASVAGVTQKVGGTWTAGQTSMQLVIDAIGDTATLCDAGGMSTDQPLDIGGALNCGNVRNVQIWKKAKTEAELIDLTYTPPFIAPMVNSGYTALGGGNNQASAATITIPMGDGVPDLFTTQNATAVDSATGGWHNEGYTRFNPGAPNPEAYACLASVTNLSGVLSSGQIVVEYMIRIGPDLRDNIDATRLKFKSLIVDSNGTSGDRLLSEIQSSGGANNDFFVPVGRGTLGVYKTPPPYQYYPDGPTYPAEQLPNLCDYEGEFVYLAFVGDIAANNTKAYIWTQDGTYSGLHIDHPCDTGLEFSAGATEWQTVSVLGFTGNALDVASADAYVDIQRITIKLGTTTPDGPPAGFVI